VAAVIELGTDTFTTLAGAKFLDATPAVGDLVVIVIANSAATAGTAPTDNNADGLGTYTLAETCVNKSSVDYASVYIRNALIGSATSTRFTNNNASNNGGGLCVLKVTGMTKTGATAKRQSAKQDNMSAGTPAPVLSSAALTTNPVVGVVLNGTSPATMLSRCRIQHAHDGRPRHGFGQHRDRRHDHMGVGLVYGVRCCGRGTGRILDDAVERAPCPHPADAPQRLKRFRNA
jgi:predicted outer membrane repeat protein